MSDLPSPPSPTPAPWGGRVLGGAGVLCALAVLALTVALVPDYWRLRGFPLDDAWIHAVYARSVAHGDGLSYNPGVPSTGETSPLWAVVLAVAHLGNASVERAVLVTKLVGFLLHALTAAGLYVALRDAGRRWAASAALLVLMSPHLVAASLSGMEVPLATLAAVGFLLALRSRRPGLYVLCGALGPLARPEVGLFLFLLPLVVRPEPGGKPLLKRWLQAAVGVALGCGAWALWNLHASGRPLPATFYAKVGTSNRLPLLATQWAGFFRLVPELSWPGPVLAVLVLVAIVILVRRRAPRPGPERLGAGLVAVALVFCSVSQALLRQPAVQIFYTQRYLLPAIPFLLAAPPLLLGRWLEARLAAKGTRLATAVAVLLPLALATGLPARLSRLENDAHNIDDLQVQEGLFLSKASPEDVVWVLDAGASRFLGRAFVVDLVGLNTHQMLGDEVQAYLDAHRPRFMEWAQGWGSVQPDDLRTGMRAVHRFQVTTDYTVTREQALAKRLLLECAPSTGGVYERAPLRWRYTCAAEPR
ncbi:hypothetical protein [Melittangium boletus]|uniref:Glycosyltransferase RgtA/B/C/D-like domain-containing protein n=1 Tax=Melittangium boletus DSM 14713 TaxID=1294270 RepID=A0A250I8M9_9BACT|nr:hypothetical protein [Melittangium boletus]ATB27512.1 hypothetical protein MEBOL_000955 [Melittangium boletus DSM 14713]